MSFITQCPFCANTAKVPDTAEAGTAKCPKCGSSFSVARLEEGLDGRSKALAGQTALSVTPGDPVPTAATTPQPRDHDADDEVPTSPPAFGNLLAADEESSAARKKRWLHSWGVFSVFCAGEALLFASITYLTKLTVPLCVLGLIVAVLGFFQAEPKNKIQAAWLIAGAVLSLMLLIFALAWPAVLGPTYYFGRLL